jgi:CRP-like cAMP-binding protein
MCSEDRPVSTGRGREQRVPRSEWGSLPDDAYSPAHVMGFRATEGSLIGLPATFGIEPYSMTAEVLAGSELEKMDRDHFWQMLIKKPALSLDVLRILAAETRRKVIMRVAA